MGGGGELGTLGFGFGLKYLSRPILRLTDAATFSSSVEIADEREDESDPDIMQLKNGGWLVGGTAWWESCSLWAKVGSYVSKG